MPDCVCASPDAPFDQFRSSATVGVDPTDGRFAEVRIDQCVTCGQRWLHYAVEYEGFSRSGRWARGPIDAADAATIAPEATSEYLARLPFYVFGGSYFDGAGEIGTGPMNWGP
jgi:hypothetical protein